MKTQIPVTKKMWEEINANPHGLLPKYKCVTCGDWAGWGEHKGCEHDKKNRLIVWEK